MSRIFDRVSRPSRGPVLLGAVALGLLSLAGLTRVPAGETAIKAAATAASAATVNIENFKFLPPALTVAAGTTVTWKNEDDSPHRIGGKGGTFTSAALDCPSSGFLRQRAGQIKRGSGASMWCG
jgi:plastocyanin